MDMPSRIVEDCGGVVQLFSDGTVFRLKHIDFNMPVVNDQSVVYKDFLFDEPRNLSLRLYKPTTALAKKKFPILFFFHGGGFVVGSRDWPNCQNTCQRLAVGLHAVVIAPDYRLAPEHRLPAALDDGVTAVKWLQAQALKGGDGWLTEGVDFDRVYVMGDSSGGNIAHHLAVRLGAGSPDMRPVRVRGYVLLAPFFGGVGRTESEEGPSEKLLNLEILDRFWRLCLPAGETRDHPAANPFGPGSPNLEEKAMGPMLVIVGGCELLRDRVRDYATRLKEMAAGKKVEYVEIEGKQHGFFTDDPYSDESEDFVGLFRRFMLENCD
ncbi:Probable carboxylesterase 15 [Linum grandiflorum]